MSDRQRRAIFARLAEHNQGLVHKVVGQHMRKFGPRIEGMREDLISAGNVGLLEFARRYNPRRSTRFSTGAVIAIRNRVLREIQKTTVRVPERHIKKLAALGPLPSTVEFAPEVHGGRHADDGGIGAVESRVHVQQLLRRLPLQERRVLQLRVLQDLPAKAVAQRLRMKPLRIKKIQQRAIKRLNQYVTVSEFAKMRRAA